MRKRILNWVLLISITSVVLIGVVAIVELYCAYSYYRYRDTLKNELNAIRLKEPLKNQNSINFKTDSLGFILPYKSLDKVSKKVIFLGGSTTECRAVNEDKRIHIEVQRSLLNTSCLNIGNSGNHSMHTLDILANKIVPLNPDVVVINHNVNDLSILLNTGTYFNNHPRRSLIINNSDQLYSYKVGYPKNWLVRNFIPHISLVLLPTTFEGLALSENEEFSKSPLKPNMDIDALKEMFSKSLKGIVSYAKSWGIKPILMTQGSCFRYYGVDNVDKYDGYNLDSLHSVFNNVVRKVAKKSNCSLVDAEFLMEDNKSFFIDCVHYNDSGSVFISKYISSEIKKLLN